MFDDSTYTTATFEPIKTPKLTLESMKKFYEETEELRRKAEEADERLAELGLKYDPLTKEIRIIDQLRMPDGIRRKFLRSLYQQFLDNATDPMDRWLYERNIRDLDEEAA